MIKKIYMPESVSVLVLCAAAAITLWPLGRLKQEVSASIASLERRGMFVAEYRKKQKDTPCERLAISPMDEPQVLAKLQETAQKAGLLLEYLDVKPPQAGRSHNHKAVAFDLVVSGQEAGLIGFLDGVKNSGFLNRVVSLEISAGARQEAGVRARLKLEKVDHSGIRAVFRKKSAASAAPALKRRLFKEASAGTAKNIGSPEKARPERVKDLSLVGIIDDGGRKAVLEDKKTGKAVFLQEGDCLEGICVAEIGAGEVTLEQGGAEFRLVL